MKHAIHAAVLALFLLLVSGPLAVAFDWSGRTLDRDTLCPNLPISQAVYIDIDRTDPRAKLHVEAFLAELDILIDTAADGTRFTIRVLTPEAERLVTPVYDRCKPPIATSWFAGNPWLDGKRYQERFLSPLKQAVTQALATPTKSNDSPLIQAFALLTSESTFRHAQRQTLFVFSDLMQFEQSNPLADFYRQVPSYQDLARRHPGYFDLDLSRSDIIILLTPAVGKHLPPATVAQQQEKAIHFWQDYFAAAHAARVTFRAL